LRILTAQQIEMIDIIIILKSSCVEFTPVL
jgi:hypothetical protein